MLHTPLKQNHPPVVGNHGHGHGHAPAQHTQPASTRCTPQSVHGTHPHELNFADWLHMSPAQVAVISPIGVPYTPPSHLFVPTPSPLQYVTTVNARNDFLATSPLPFSSPFQVPVQYPQPYPYAVNSGYQQLQMQAQPPTISVSVEDPQNLQDPLVQAQATDNLISDPADPTLSLSLATEYFPYTGNSAPTSSSTSPISHADSPFPFQNKNGSVGEGESTPVTTLSGMDESHGQTQDSPQENNGQLQPFLDRLRGASPITEVSNSASTSPVRTSMEQSKPIESIESPFRIAAPQPRAGSGPFSSLSQSSRPSSALGALSELAELASQRSTPSHPLAQASMVTPLPQSHSSSRAASRPASAMSIRSTASHMRLPRVRRRNIPHRFAPSVLRVSLPYQTPSPSTDSNGKPITPSCVDGLARGPLEFEEEGHRYRTRSKLKSLKAEIQEREREADLLLIRRGLRGESASSEEHRSGLDMLADVSVTRCVELASPSRSATPLANQNQILKMTRSKRGVKRTLSDLNDADSESISVFSGSESRTPPKRPRVVTEKAISAKGRKGTPDTVSNRTRSTRSLHEMALSSSAPVRSQRNRKAASPSKPSASSKKSPVKKVMAMDVDESELSSLTSMSETEDGKSSAEDMDYAPKKNARSSRSKSASFPATISKAASSKSTSKAQPAAKDKSTPIDTAGGASAIAIPVRTFPPEVPLHAGFALLYRKFPICGYTDPNVLSIARFSGSPLSSSSWNSSESDVANLPQPSSGHFNAPRSAEDLYTPRFVRGVGRDKMGLCPICYESPERGGAGRAEWLSMKFSAFNYHMQYAHGISPVTALPFSPPIAFRTVSRTPNHKNEKSEILEGKCHRCGDWAPVEGVKCVEAKLKEIYWWKHAAACHKGSTISGECDVHLEDAVARRVRTTYGSRQACTHAVVPFAHPCERCA